MEDIKKTANLSENRLIIEGDDLALKIANFVEPFLLTLNYRLVRVSVNNPDDMTLQIMAEKADGTLNINDCEIISNSLSRLLDTKEIMDSKYNLEISSPGLDRPLVRKSDFARHISDLIKVRLKEGVDGQYNFKAIIKEVNEDYVILKLDERDIPVYYSNIKSSKLLLDDSIIKASLKKKKSFTP